MATSSDSPVVTQLSGTTALLLLAVFTVVNVACMVLRRLPDERSGFFRSPGPTPVLAGILSLGLIVVPWNERDPLQYEIAAYRPRIEGLFARIERWTAVGTGISHWRSIGRDKTAPTQ